LAEKAEAASAGRTLVLGDLMTDPAGFAAGMVELARQTLSESESLEDRLYALYQEAGQKLQVEQPDRKESLFEGLAKSVLSLEPSRRDGFIAGKLYADLDSEIVSERKIELDEQAPNQVHELVTGRYSTTWTVLEVSELLKKATLKKAESASPPPAFPAPEAVPLPGDLADMAKELAVYTEEEMEAIKTMSEEGMESDIIEASVRTLIHLLSLVKDPLRPAPTNTDVELFSRIIHQLEDLLVYLLKNKDYRLASVVTQAFHMPVDPAFKPRMAEALKKTTSRNAIAAMIADMRKNPRGSPEYEAARAYLATVEREATNVLLELLAEEPDRTTRLFILELAKELGKNQIMLLGERLSDDRWYYVRNIVSILGETKTDQAIAFLRKAADHRNVRIRQEVVKGLLSIGGKKAASVLIKFIRDRDASLRMTAIQGIGELSGIGAEEEESFLEFLAELPLNARNRDLTLAAIAAIGRVGSPRAAAFLKRYDRIRWWRSRKLQETLRDAAQQSAEEIMRRTGDGGSSRG
jgi:HEAT repeat protein